MPVWVDGLPRRDFEDHCGGHGPTVGRCAAIGARATASVLAVPAPQHPVDLRIQGADSGLDEKLSQELDAYNRAASGFGDQQEFTVKVEDNRGLVAGLSGWTWGTCAGIAMVWVREDSRRTGIGSRLLTAAEQVARDRACRRLTVSSFTFQAPAFYERHGFIEFARTEGVPVEGQADVHFVRMLTP